MASVHRMLQGYKGATWKTKLGDSPSFHPWLSSCWCLSSAFPGSGSGLQTITHRLWDEITSSWTKNQEEKTGKTKHNSSWRHWEHWGSLMHIIVPRGSPGISTHSCTGGSWNLLNQSQSYCSLSCCRVQVSTDHVLFLSAIAKTNAPARAQTPDA